MSKHQVDNLFSEKLSNFEVQPLKSSWEAIQENLKDKKTNNNGIRKIWYSAAAAVIFLTVVSTGLYFSMEAARAPGEVVSQETPILPSKNGLQAPPEQLVTRDLMDNPAVQVLDEDGQEPMELSALVEAEVDPVHSQKGSHPAKEESVGTHHTEFVITGHDAAIVTIRRATARIDDVSPHWGTSMDWQMELMSTYDLSYLDRSRFARALNYAIRLKNGDEPLFDLRKAKNDLFDMAKNVKLKSDNSELNMD